MDLNNCFNEINAYFENDKTGYPLVVNTENYTAYQKILTRLEADGNTQCVYITDCCLPNGWPDIDNGINAVSGRGNFALIGLSQALKLYGRKELNNKLGDILGKSIKGYCVVLTEHCEMLLRAYGENNPKYAKRIILADVKSSPLPKIKIAGTDDALLGVPPLDGFKALLDRLIHMSDEEIALEDTLTVLTHLPIDLLDNTVYQINALEHIYSRLVNKYPELKDVTSQDFGSEEQWRYLAESIKKFDSLAGLAEDEFGKIGNPANQIKTVLSGGDPNRFWLLWLAMKVYDKRDNLYLSMALGKSRSVDEFKENIYTCLLDADYTDKGFDRLYFERKDLINGIGRNVNGEKNYCNALGLKRRDAIYYLTDLSGDERHTFIDCVCKYDYTDEEITCAARRMSPDLLKYLKDFSFDESNTSLAPGDKALLGQLTEYFREYKRQKLTNRLDDRFLAKVEQYAESRPYNKLPSRSSVISHLDKSDCCLYFFDALGVEYLSFIWEKCREYDLNAEISVARGELPSITTKNQEFLQSFNENNIVKISGLDDLKHHSKIYDYKKTPLPVYIFDELEIIGKELDKIHAALSVGTYSKAVIAADHGASRLAVLYGKTADEKIKLEEPGVHSGRCCKTEENPQLPFTAYEDGFAVLANYERFSGGRAANLEVHGGASLEEVLVPVITISPKPVNSKIEFMNDGEIVLIPNQKTVLSLYSTLAIQAPRLLVKGQFIDGVTAEDNNHVDFDISFIKRSGEYDADVFDGNTKMASLKFKTKKRTIENKLDL